MAIVSKIDSRSDDFARNAQRYADLLTTLRERMAWAVRGGGDRLMQRHIERGKLPVRQRIDLLLDVGSPFLEIAPLAAWGMYDNEVPAAGLVAGIGLVEGVHCMIIANDATVKGGSFFRETVRKHVRAQDIAAQNRLPCLYLVDCGGAYLPEQDQVFPDWGHFGTTFYNQCRMSAEGLPQLSAVFGGCTAGGAYIPALSDEAIIVQGTGRIHLGGPPIVKAAINEIVDGETLGGAAMHTRVSGVTDYLAADERQALAKLRQIVRHLNLPPSEPFTVGAERPPRFDASEIPGIVGCDMKQPYDVREVLLRLVDDSELQEFKPEYGTTLVCASARLHGYPVGILANNGVLFSESSVKGAHFIELCNQRNIPLLFLQNITGFMVGTEAERGGIAKHSAKLVYAMSTARVPRLTVLIGGSYGAGNYGMCGRGFAPHFLFAWPNSRIATMSPEVATTVLTELRKSSLKGDSADEQLAALARETTEQFTRQSDPFYASARLWDDGIIEPAQTRDVLGLCLQLLAQSNPRATGASPVFRM
ncbi:MAG: carboxyl transferase domain-containing protein [Rhodoferax sp.]|uniref:acyl-CoA carboxylase subunit beta n=1 Tax=Rhodoferax sp. TaxID=50421 RepID=UPI00262313EB|nr:carboxyl transferase domain-containing protein [Rhodoferax sp.]MDD5332990.1 carboxyl transferase domain-containing protein [Rhodoferax sp.]